MGDLAANTKLFIDSVDPWLLIQPSLIDLRLTSFATHRLRATATAAALAQQLTALGLHGSTQSSVGLQGQPDSRCGIDQTAHGGDIANGNGLENPSYRRSEEDNDGDRQENRRT
jgi:hypothetical protein